MKLTKQLIPRNNWDYGLKALFGSLAGITRPSFQAARVDEFFHQKAVWTNSGRTSLYALLKAMEIPEGAEVGVPLFCCSVVFNAICQAGLQPRFIDSNLHDYNLSVEDLRKKREGLAAIVPVHMFGNPVDMDAILAVAGDIPVIEDCAQSVYATYQGKQTGTLSTASFFSFRCGKYISAGEGSAILCRDEGLQKKVDAVVQSFESPSRLKLLIETVSTFIKATMYNRPWYGWIGYPVGMKLDEKLNLTAKGGFQAAKIAPTYLALINERIERYQEKINIQRQHAHKLLGMLKPGKFTLLSETDGKVSNWYQFAVRFESPEKRDAAAEYLLSKGIDTAKYLDDIADDARAHYGYRGGCPNAEVLSRTVLLVPIHYNLSNADIEHIARSLNEAAQTL